MTFARGGDLVEGLNIALFCTQFWACDPRLAIDLRGWISRPRFGGLAEIRSGFAVFLLLQCDTTSQLDRQHSAQQQVGLPAAAVENLAEGALEVCQSTGVTRKELSLPGDSINEPKRLIIRNCNKSNAVSILNPARSKFLPHSKSRWIRLVVRSLT